MKRFAYLAVIFYVFLACFASSVFAAETYTLDPNHTYVLWHIKHFDFSTQAGKWYASGKLMLDKENPANSKVNAVIKVSEFATGLPELDEHLKGKLFFNTQQFPTATFVSDKIDITGEKSANVHGILTVHGVSKPVTLAVMLNKAAISPITGNPTVGFSATTTIKRSDFGITTYVPALGDEVLLNIEAEAFQPKK